MMSSGGASLDHSIANDQFVSHFTGYRLGSPRYVVVDDFIGDCRCEFRKASGIRYSAILRQINPKRLCRHRLWLALCTTGAPAITNIEPTNSNNAANGRMTQPFHKRRRSRRHTKMRTVTGSLLVAILLACLWTCQPTGRKNPFYGMYRPVGTTFL